MEKRRTWDAVKWIGFALLIAGTGAAASGALAAKADADDVKELRSHIREHDIQFTRLEADSAWIKSALYRLTLREGVAVPPPPPPLIR